MRSARDIDDSGDLHEAVRTSAFRKHAPQWAAVRDAALAEYRRGGDGRERAAETALRYPVAFMGMPDGGAFWSRALAGRGSFDAVWNALRTAQKKGDHGAADACARRLLEILPDRGPARALILVEWARSHAARNDFVHAAELSRRAFSLCPDDAELAAEALETLSDAFEAGYASFPREELLESGKILQARYFVSAGGIVAIMRARLLGAGRAA